MLLKRLFVYLYERLLVYHKHGLLYSEQLFFETPSSVDDEDVCAGGGGGVSASLCISHGCYIGPSAGVTLGRTPLHSPLGQTTNCVCH